MQSLKFFRAKTRIVEIYQLLFQSLIRRVVEIKVNFYLSKTKKCRDARLVRLCKSIFRFKNRVRYSSDEFELSTNFFIPSKLNPREKRNVPSSGQ